MMKKVNLYRIFLASLVVSCTESLEDKAAREAKEYTEKYCPTPYVNDSRTDSAAFDKTTKMYHLLHHSEKQGGQQEGD